MSLMGRLLLLVLCLGLSFSVNAAMPLVNEVDDSGIERVSVPPVWDNSGDIEFHYESGTCGDFSNAEMATKLATNLQVWTSISTVDLSFSGVSGELGDEDIDSSNYTDYFYVDSSSDEALLTDGINPVLFDDDGGIITALFGSTNQYAVLGLAGISYYADGEILDGQVIINCKCLPDNPNGDCEYGGVSVTFTEDDLDFTLVHEMGHFLNMGHSEANYDIYMDGTYDEGEIPIMFPVASNMTDIEPHEDDVVTLTMLYPKTELTDDYCLVEGYIVDSSGDYVSCLDIWAESDDLSETTTYVTGGYNYMNTNTSDDFDSTDTCDAYCGYFTLYIKPDTDYTIMAYDVYSGFTGGSSVGPCVDSQPEYGLEAEVLATISASECSDPSSDVIDLGKITVDADATSTTDSDGSGGGSGSGSGKSSGGGDKNPVGYWCSLSQTKVDVNTNLGFLFCIMNIFVFLFLIKFFHRKEKKVLVLNKNRNLRNKRYY